jgi:hypothetical protein
MIESEPVDGRCPWCSEELDDEILEERFNDHP